MPAPLYVLAVFVLLFLLHACAGGTQAKPIWQSAPGVDIPAWSTYGWPESQYGAPATILDTAVRDTLRAELGNKGYQETEDEPDFLVSYEAVESEALKQGNPVRIGIGVGTFGGNVGGSVGTSVGVGGKDKVLMQQRITIHAVNPETNSEVWKGTTTTLDERPESQSVQRAVSDVMAGFPEKR